MMRTLSIVVPVFNEESVIAAALERVRSIEIPGWKKELIIVDDGSTDGTADILKKVASDCMCFRHERNQGKGASLKTGFAAATGDALVIQDADLEYDPSHYADLLGPVEQGKADVVYGSRFITVHPRRVLYIWH